MGTPKVKFKLQGHEKFPLREGWINKGLIAVSEKKNVFLDKEVPAPDELGIGNNMVKSLRYWLKAYGLIEDNGTKGAELTPFGQMILDNDKYLERNFTLWCLHSEIVKNREDATTWFLFFNHCDVQELTKDQIFQILRRELVQLVEGQKFSDKSMQNDIDVLLNMYSKAFGGDDPEEKNVSPFAQLGLVKKTDGSYIKSHPDRRKISEWEILYELAILMKDSDQISIEKAIENENGIANIYQITNVQANEYFDRLDAMGYIHVNRTAGLDMIYRSKEFTRDDVMREYYQQH